MTIDHVVDKIGDLPSFIKYLENTTDNEWQTDFVRNSANSKNCLFGHLVNWFYGKDYDGVISPAWDMFEETWATTFEIYEINDGRDKRYPQPTPKRRCIEHLKNLWLGLAEPTWVQMEAK